MEARGNGSCVHGEVVRLKLCQADVVWPAMIWKWFSMESAVHQQGCRLWSLIPHLWHPWFLHSVHELHPAYTAVTLETPPCSFVDLTERRNVFQRALAMKQGAMLKNSCKQHLYAIVWCPLGESDYLHLCGSLPLDLIVNRLYGDSLLMIKGNVWNDLAKAVGIISNFLDGNYTSITCIASVTVIAQTKRSCTTY